MVLIVVDFREELSKMTLSEHPNSLFKFHGEAVHNRHDVAIMPSEFDNMQIIDGGSSNKPFRQNRSSSSGFSVAEQEPEVKCEAFSERQSRCRVTNHSLGTMPLDLTSQQKSDEHSSPSVKSWAAVLAMGKSTKQPTLASVVRGSQNNQTKPSKCSSDSSPVNCPGRLKVDTQSWVDKSKCRSASRDSDHMHFVSSDANSNRMSSNDKESVKQQENHSAAWVTVRDKKTKPRSQTPQLRGDVSTQVAGSCVAVKSKQDNKDERAGIADGPGASGSQSKAMKQKKKKKKKSKGPDVAVDKASDAMKRMEETTEKRTLSVPEFHNVTEFPSLFGSKSISKKTALETSIPGFTPGIFTFCPIHITYCLVFMLSLIHCVSKKRPTFTTCYNFYMHSSIAAIFGTNVAEKVRNQTVLYFPTSRN